MTQVSGDTRFAIPSDVVFREVAGEIMILHLGTATYFGLDDVGTRVWQLLTEGATIDRVCAAMTAEFDASGNRIESDVRTLVQQLLDKQLLQPAP